jgi:NatC N(alpha)-terminal acetyltransferase Mak10 subunit
MSGCAKDCASFTDGMAYIVHIHISGPAMSFDDARFGRDQKPDARDVEGDRPWAHLVLRVYCLALVKACDLVLARVTSECYYEVSFLNSLSLFLLLSSSTRRS